MSDIDKSRIQHEAQRTVANRKTIGSSSLEQALLRHLGVELYAERRRRESAEAEANAEADARRSE